MGRAFEFRKERKMKRWDKMSKLFPKLSKAITLAAKEGVLDPEMNAKLRAAILNAKAENMPKDNIDAAIKRASGKDADTITEVTFEGKGSNGVQYFIECATDNNTRTVANIKSYFNKHGGHLLQNGALEFMFTRKAVFEIEKRSGIDVDALELELIDFGLEDLEETDDTVYLYGDYTEFGNISKGLEKLGIVPRKATLQRISTAPVELSDEEYDKAESLIDKIEDDEDVVNVFTNIM
ncbi:MAG: YebC/PmpR family DNA-binding transcriptional regulator [Chitinispirillales bacterium]|jgi:YebC/PmpR family DNA-binding regulatory protein|nr:YebC/PmpR family DNA-binding transcriptional regulator [Chitinispirillales bacterium]